MGRWVMRRRRARSLVPRLAVVAVSVASGLAASSGAPRRALSAEDFIRGDANSDGKVELSDAVRTFGWLFLGQPEPGCLDAADTNDSGAVDLSDGVSTLNFLFLGGPAPASPGPAACGPDPTADSLGCAAYPLPGCGGPGPTDDLATIGHVLNRLAYGPTQETVADIQERGLTQWIQEQLSPETIDESSNVALQQGLDALFDLVTPSRDAPIVPRGATWRFFKGTVAPPAGWNTRAFDDAAWLEGPAGIGYADGDDATVLSDMQGAYVSVYARRRFTVADLAAVRDLVLRIDYDDGFVAYLNGTEVARRGLSGAPPAHTATASSHEAGTPEEFDLTSRKSLLVVGENSLAVQVHNASAGSSDLSIHPELLSRELLDVPPRTVIRGTDALQELLHVRGIHSRRQLQAVLAEFWENHLTTDLDKVAEYLDGLQNSDGSDAMTQGQARSEAAQLEYEEYQFFHDHALGNFGDLLLFSATSPTMLIYLDNVLNVVGNANENYSREIYELHAYGVDNRYTQTDIEQLARCFTGWTICKVEPGAAQPFPLSATSPPVECGVKFEDRPLVDAGAGWRYLKGTAEPTPDPGSGAPTTGWALPAFDDASWTAGSTGIGYGDDDDATRLTDMRNSYASVYLRREFSIADPAALRNLVLEVRYDDGFVAYLNGVEVARSESMEDTGTPPAHDRSAAETHEANEGAEIFNLNRFRSSVAAGTNVLAIQVHNASIDSSDLSIIPRLLDREILPGSVEAGDPTGRWAFRFVPELHDVSAKTLHRNTPYRIDVPAGRTGMSGLADALDVVRGMVDHPSTAEFVCIKLIQRFVSDEITLATYRAGTAPLELRELLATAVAAWNSTSPRGNIRTVLEAILDPVGRGTEFWQTRSRGAKVKTPIEFANSTLRVLDGFTSGTRLRSSIGGMGMAFFTRDDPDGWSELGFRWIDTGSMLERINFGQDVASNADARVGWDPTAYLAARGISTPEEIVGYFEDLMFQGTLSGGERALLLEFLTTDDGYAPGFPAPGTAAYTARIRDFVGLLVSLPRWQFQ